MTNISCSILEQVRKNPIAYAQVLGIGRSIQKGGTHGMFAYWQDIAKRMHIEELTISEALKELSSIYRRRFENNPRNERKQEWLYNAFVDYEKAAKATGLSFFDGKRRIQWPLISEIQLTGLTPWVFKKSERYYAYFYSEKSFYWQAELKYPLLQQYMASHLIKCELNVLHIGVYFLDTGSFESRNYSKREIKDTIIEATAIFEKVKLELTRKNSSPNNK